MNYYRITELKEKLINPGYSHSKIESLAFDVGFNTPSSFYVAFKKQTGLTPKEFKKIHKKAVDYINN